MSENQEMGWDSEIDPGEVNKPKSLLPEGEAFFTVVEMKRDRRPLGKLGVCNIADITLMVTSTNTDGPGGDVEDSLPLHPDMMWKVLQFFTAIGQRQHGDNGKFTPDWGKLEEAGGRCVINHRKYTGRDGAEKLANNVERYLAEGEEYKPAAKKGEPKTAAPAQKSKPKF